MGAASNTFNRASRKPALLVALTLFFCARVPLAQEVRPPTTAGEEAAGDPRAQARLKFLEARAAHERGEFEEAAALFEEAHRIAPNASVKFNAGIAWDRAGRLARAADAYETALQLGGLEESQATEASTRLAALKQVLGTVRIEEPVGAVVSVAHVDRATIPVRLHVEPGTYKLHIEGDESRSTDHELRVGAGEVATVRVTLPEAKPVRSAPPPRPRPAPAKPPPVRDQPPPSNAQATWGWVALGGAVVLSGAAIFLGINALDARDEFENSGNIDRDAHDRAASLRTWTNVAWGGALVTGGLGLFLVLSSPEVEF